jgi:polar amino acid transport system substrate-binding protein
MKRPIFWVILAMSIFMSVAFVGAEPKELLIGKPDTDYPPFHWTEEDGKITGICPDVITEVAKLLGINKITYKQYPWKRMLENAENGNVDAVMPLFITPERSKFLYFPKEELAFEINVFFTLKESDIQYSGDLQKLKSYRIGAIKGYSYGGLFDNSNLQQEYAVNEKMLLNKLQAHRYQIGIGNILVLKHFSQKMDLSIRILKPYVSRDPLFIGFSQIKDNKNFVNEFSNAIKKFKRTEKYQQLLNKYTK